MCRQGKSVGSEQGRVGRQQKTRWWCQKVQFTLAVACFEVLCFVRGGDMHTTLKPQHPRAYTSVLSRIRSIDNAARMAARARVCVRCVCVCVCVCMCAVCICVPEQGRRFVASEHAALPLRANRQVTPMQQGCTPVFTVLCQLRTPVYPRASRTPARRQPHFSPKRS